MSIVGIASFTTNLILSAFYFSQIIGTKGYLNRYGFLISFLGTGVGTIFYLLLPLLPESIPWMDICAGLIVVIWLPLTRHYTQMGWLGSFGVAAFGALFYMVVSWLVSAFILGLLITFGVVPASIL